MATKIRPELSRRNKWWIPKYRFLELKYFCLQYNMWKQEYRRLSEDLGMVSKLYTDDRIKSKNIKDNTADIAIRRSSLKHKIDMVERVTFSTDKELGSYIFKAVTENLTYPDLYTMYEIPCSNDMYYDRWHKFYYLLDKEKN